ncbi:MAG: type III polyketide synthase [Mariniphaga sp.]
MSRIISTATAVPEYIAAQENILGFMCGAYNNETVSRKLRILFHSSGIDARHSVVPDFGRHTQGSLFFGNGKPDIEKRMDLFRQNAAGLAIAAIKRLFEKLNTGVKEFGITHLITVTCTGLYSPGLETEIMERLQLPSDIFHTAVNFMGCNAAFPAQKIADSFARSDKNARVLVVCVELCTIHFQPKDDNDNLLSNTIFGDGAAAFLMVSDEYAREKKFRGLSVEGFHSGVLGEGKELMGWNVKPLNFEMVLSAGIPSFIGQKINRFIADTSRNLEVSPEEIDRWAVHPGGRKILDQVKKQLGLTNGQMDYSYRILREYGNMSSPTILFILNLILEQELKPGEKILAIGFGPGISVDTALYCYEGEI